MSSIDRLAAQDAARTYTQTTDVARSGGAQQAAKAHYQAKHTKSADSVTLSDGAKTLAAAREVVKNAPDVRDDKVSEIKQKVSDGTYSVSAKVLARKMLDTQA
jgi:flagellar biosynthesis anti-sigma factor FlgM